MNYENITLYFALEMSKAVNDPSVSIKDIATIFCSNKDIEISAGNIKVFTFPDKEEASQVVTSMKLIELISKEYKGIQITAIGAPEIILYYKNSKNKTHTKNKIRAAFLIMIAFLGAAYSIMSYNCDVGSKDLLNKLHELYIGEIPNGSSIGMLAYSVGLFVGIIIFFNHGITNKYSNDPTPLQVQMRVYEQDVNQALIIDSTRHNHTMDKDK